MKFGALMGGLLMSPLPQLGPSNHKTRIVRGRSMLVSPPGHPSLPTPSQISSNIKINNIQAEVLLGMKQTMESFLFFTIENPTAFKQGITRILPQITTVNAMLDPNMQPPTLVNLGISQKGLDALGITENINDTDFTAGQLANAPALSESTDLWVEQFKSSKIDGVFMIASDTSNLVKGETQSIKNIFGSSINIVYTIQGQVRPGSEAGHEHFGFLDGVSQPLIQGFGPPFPGQAVVPPGIILLGGDQDNVTRPAWTADSSIMAFRQLQQLVPEFNKFLDENPAPIPGMPKNLASDLTGARIVGRWKSGAPLDLAPIFDDPDLGADPTRNNNFNFTHAGMNSSSDQSRCPFAAHIRKTVPRTDLTPVDLKHHIMRGGLPYGPEVTASEQAQQKTTQERGLLFTCFQSNLALGFKFLQQAWINNVNFVGHKSLMPGFDPLLGQNNGSDRWMHGLDPMDTTTNTTLPQFIVSRGGEYFLIPSISALQHIIQH